MTVRSQYLDHEATELRLKAAADFYALWTFEPNEPSPYFDVEYDSWQDDVADGRRQLWTIFETLTADSQHTPDPAALDRFGDALLYTLDPLSDRLVRGLGFLPDGDSARTAPHVDLSNTETLSGVRLLKLVTPPRAARDTRGAAATVSFLLPMLGNPSIEIAARSSPDVCRRTQESLAAAAQKFIGRNSFSEDHAFELGLAAANSWPFGELLKLDKDTRGDPGPRFYAYYHAIAISKQPDADVMALIDRVCPAYATAVARARKPSQTQYASMRKPDVREMVHNAWIAFNEGRRDLSDDNLPGHLNYYLRNAYGRHYEKRKRELTTKDAYEQFVMHAHLTSQATNRSDPCERMNIIKDTLAANAKVSILDTLSRLNKVYADESNPPGSLKEAARRAGLNLNTVNKQFKTTRDLMGAQSPRSRKRPKTVPVDRSSKSKVD